MIKINLLGEETKRSTTALLWVAGYFVVMVGLLITFSVLVASTSRQIAEINSEIDVLDTNLKKIQKKTKEVHQLESMQRELNSKLSVIAVLKRSKIGPVRMLDDLVSTMPEQVWITSATERSTQVSLEGYALDNQTIADFMTALQGSNYFENVDLVQTRGAVLGSVPLKSFVLRATVNYAGKIKEKGNHSSDGVVAGSVKKS